VTNENLVGTDCKNFFKFWKAR